MGVFQRISLFEVCHSKVQKLVGIYVYLGNYMTSPFFYFLLFHSHSVGILNDYNGWVQCKYIFLLVLLD